MCKFSAKINCTRCSSLLFGVPQVRCIDIAANLVLRSWWMLIQYCCSLTCRSSISSLEQKLLKGHKFVPLWIIIHVLKTSEFPLYINTFWSIPSAYLFPSKELLLEGNIKLTHNLRKEANVHFFLHVLLSCSWYFGGSVCLLREVIVVWLPLLGCKND